MKKQIGESALSRLNGYGLKTLVRNLLCVPALNGLLVRLIRPWRKHISVLGRFPVVGEIGRYAMGNGGVVLMQGTDRCEIAKSLYWSEGRLADPTDSVVVRVVEILACEADLLLDVGAYTGFFALVGARANPGLCVVGYEIFPENHLLAMSNVIRNKLESRVDIRLRGLGNTAATITMPAQYSQSVLPSSLSLDSEFQSGVVVPVSTLDEEYPDFTGTALMKIDVEGFEGEVLDGGRQFIRRCRPDIVCEVLAGSAPRQSIANWCETEGYSVFAFEAGGLRLQPDLSLATEGKDWLLTTRTPANLAEVFGDRVGVLCH